MTSNENLLGSFVTFFDHGLLVVEDSESSAAHDEWDSASEYVHFEDDSIYVAVQSVVDGPVEVCIYRENRKRNDMEGLTETFSGNFESRSGRLRIHDSDEKTVVTVPMRRGSNRLAVLVDELNFAARVVVLVGEVDVT
jgi:hypothetical protein